MLHSDLLHGGEKSIWFCFSSSGGPPTLPIEGETPGAGGDERQPFESWSEHARWLQVELSNTGSVNITWKWWHTDHLK